MCVCVEHLFLMFLDHTQRRSIVGRTPLDEWSARRRDLYLTTHNTHNRHTSMPLVGFELTISAGERAKTYALDRTATGTSTCLLWLQQMLQMALLPPTYLYMTDLDCQDTWHFNLRCVPDECSIGGKWLLALDFKLLPCSECCMF